MSISVASFTYYSNTVAYFKHLLTNVIFQVKNEYTTKVCLKIPVNFTAKHLDFC